MGHLYHGELLNNQRVNDLMIFDQILISVKYPDMIAQIGDQIWLWYICSNFDHIW